VSAQGIEFLNSFEEARKKAKEESKIIFADFYTSWCGPCKFLSKNVFTQKEAGDYFNANFINVKVQCDDKGEGEAVNKKYQVPGYPTLMILDSEGNIMGSHTGGLSVAQLIEFAEKSLDTKNNMLAIQREFESKNCSDSTVVKYFNMLAKGRRLKKAVTDFSIYFNKLNDDKKRSKFTFDLITKVGLKPFTAEFEYIEKNCDVYYKVASQKRVSKYIYDSYLGYLFGLQDSDFSKYQTKLDEFKSKNYSFKKEICGFLWVFEELRKNSEKYDLDEYMRRADKFLSEYGNKNDAYTITITHMLGNLSLKKDASLIGVKWMENLLKRNRKTEYLYTFMYILERNHCWDKATKIALEIKEATIKNGESCKYIDSRIENIKKAKNKLS
jgi:thiol-disulfide isomerase/thioredoxin